MSQTRKPIIVLSLLGVASLLVASCGSESSSRQRNSALETSDSTVSESPDTSQVSTDSVQPEDTQVDGGESENTTQPTVSILNPDDEDNIVTPQGADESSSTTESDSETSTTEGPASEPEVGESGGEITVDVPEEDVVENSTTTSTTSTSTTVAPDPNAREWIDDSLGSMKVGVPFNDGLQARGPGGVMAFILTNGTILPPGLGLNIYGGVSGTPTKAGTYSFSIYVGFWKGLNGLGKSFTVTVEPADQVVGADPKWNDTHLGLMIERIGYSDGFSASPTPKSYSVSGDLPPGLSFESSTGELAGTPTTQGTYKFTVTANYDNSSLSPLEVSATVTPSIDKVWIDSTLAPMYEGVRYNDGVQAGGGGYLNGTMRGVMCYIIASGSLPPGVSFQGCGGAIAGTPTSKGTYSFRVYAGFWSGSGLYLDFKMVVGDADEASTTSSTTVTASTEESTTTSESTSSTAESTSTTVGSTSTSAQSPSSTTSSGGGENVASGVSVAQPTPQVVDVVAPNMVEAQVVPAQVTVIECDSLCTDLLAIKGGKPDGDVYVRVGSNEWQKLERNADVASFVIPNGIANVQVKVVDGDSTSLLFGQVQTTGRDSQSGGNADGGSTTIWWLLGGLLLVIIAGVVLQRRQAS
jgi:hypothetical protein